MRKEIEKGKKMERNMENMEIRKEVKEMENKMDCKGLRQFVAEEEGMGTVEIILIIVVLVGLVIIFKEQITEVVSNIFKKITTQTNKV